MAKTLVDSTIAQATQTEKAASDTTLSLSLSLILLAPKISHPTKKKKKGKNLKHPSLSSLVLNLFFTLFLSLTLFLKLSLLFGSFFFFFTTAFLLLFLFSLLSFMIIFFVFFLKSLQKIFNGKFVNIKELWLFYYFVY